MDQNNNRNQNRQNNAIAPAEPIKKEMLAQSAVDAIVEGYETLTKFLAQGMPVSEAYFHEAVSGIDKTPEYYYTDGAVHKTRSAKMWWTQIGLICCSIKGKYFVIPSANVKYAMFK